MSVDTRVLDQQVSNCNQYADLVSAYFIDNGKTSEIHIDSLVFFYRIYRNERIFRVLFYTHKKLIDSICTDRYNKYRRHLYSDDLDEIKSMAYEEFYRRVMFYKIPPDAPFSKYIKLYLKKWTNAYIKLMANHRQKNLGLKDEYY